MRANGMSLVELTVVLALLGILTSLAAVAIGPLAKRYRVRQGAEAAAHALAQAQTKARATGRCHRLEAFDLGIAVAAGTAGTSLVLEALPDANCETNTAWVTLETFPLPSAVTVMVDAAVGPNPVFRPNGRSRAAGGALLRLDPGGADSRVQVSPAGAICIITSGTCP